MLKNQGGVTINLYSLNGQKIAELINESRIAGLQHEYISLPEYIKNGAYLLQVNSGTSVAYEKLIINRVE